MGFSVLVVVAMVAGRVVVPLAITFALAYALHRLDARWQAQLAGSAQLNT
jgi:hypothetical protein